MYTYPIDNQPMMQFEVFRGMGQSVLTVSDNSRWDAFYGFRRVISILSEA